MKDLLENHGVADKLLKKSDSLQRETLTDIVDGKIIKDLLLSGKVKDPDFTLLFNTDGVPVFRSSNVSIWPVQCSVCELPMSERKGNILRCGLWCGAGKPNMATFLHPLKEEAKALAGNGFQWIFPGTERVFRSRCFFVCATCDSVARPIVRNCVQFNGEYGCDWCYHPGERVEKGNGYVTHIPDLSLCCALLLSITAMPLKLLKHMKGFLV